jgi:hypothetical protein
LCRHGRLHPYIVILEPFLCFTGALRTVFAAFNYF